MAATIPVPTTSPKVAGETPASEPELASTVREALTPETLPPCEEDYDEARKTLFILRLRREIGRGKCDGRGVQLDSYMVDQMFRPIGFKDFEDLQQLREAWVPMCLCHRINQFEAIWDTLLQEVPMQEGRWRGCPAMPDHPFLLYCHMVLFDLALEAVLSEDNLAVALELLARCYSLTRNAELLVFDGKAHLDLSTLQALRQGLVAGVGDEFHPQHRRLERLVQRHLPLPTDPDDPVLLAADDE